MTAFLLFASHAAGRVHAERRDSLPLTGFHSLLWVGAHPDDEVLAAPLLASLCLEQKVHCSFLVLTRGEAGLCAAPEGCNGDLATIRSGEEAAAAEWFRADLFLLRYPDGGASADGSFEAWEALAGGRDALISSIAGFIGASGADLVVTFDPRHGSTCHSDHRATGALVIEAMKLVHPAPELYLLETRVTIGTQPLEIRFTPAADPAEGVSRLDGNVGLPGIGRTRWEAMIEDMQLHRSQFGADWIAAVRNTPVPEQALFLSRAAVALQSPAIGGCR
ncbi:MAG TPA: PIG-L family deacetylase, partial [Thermoanaerobaculia bacterium]|nr:PIG-L family deacetylase [Thermoanaerobaculia bacterium]